MKKQVSFILLAAAIIISAIGCDQRSEDNSLPSTSIVSIPESVLLKTKPEGSVSISQARNSAKPGDTIVVSGEIGGRKNDTFSPTLSTFFLADSDAIMNCIKKHGSDGCPTPWDYCCEPKEKVIASIAFIQFKSQEIGKVATQSFRGWNGLKELSQVTIKGTVDSTSSPNAIIINLEGIYIQP